MGKGFKKTINTNTGSISGKKAINSKKDSVPLKRLINDSDLGQRFNRYLAGARGQNDRVNAITESRIRAGREFKTSGISGISQNEFYASTVDIWRGIDDIGERNAAIIDYLEVNNLQEAIEKIRRLFELELERNTLDSTLSLDDAASSGDDRYRGDIAAITASRL